jgi:hypothetical protein
MSQHYPESLIGETDETWCATCGRMTKHLIVRHSEHAGRLGHCLEHGPKVNERGESKSQEKRREQREQEEKNPKLF